MAYTPRTVGNDVKVTELEIAVTDINALPKVTMASIMVDKGKAVDPQSESVMEGQTGHGHADGGSTRTSPGDDIPDDEKITVTLTHGSRQLRQDYRLSTTAFRHRER